MLPKQPTIGYTVRDETGSYGMLRFHLHSGTGRNEGLDAGQALRPIIAGLTDGSIERLSLVYAFTNSTPDTPAGNITHVGVFVFSTSEPDQYAIIEIAGIKDSVLMPSGPGEDLLIDLDNPDVEALIDALLSGVWCNRFGYQLEQIQAAFVQVRDV